jgi:hypothetical protein
MDLQVIQDPESLEFDVIDRDLGGMKVDMGFRTAEEAQTWITWTFEMDDIFCYHHDKEPYYA